MFGQPFYDLLLNGYIHTFALLDDVYQIYLSLDIVLPASSLWLFGIPVSPAELSNRNRWCSWLFYIMHIVSVLVRGVFL